MQTLNNSNFRLLVIKLFVVVLATACATRSPPVEVQFTATGGINSPHQQGKPYLLLISIDGFRWDYMDRYPTPNMDKIAAAGSKAERLIPVFPTLTFPNHYTIATGLYPARHGLVANEFPDPSRNKWYSLKKRETVEDRFFYSGEPIWVTAETQGMVTASFFFVGTEAPIKGVSPSHWRSYDKKISGEQRVDQVLNWMAEPEKRRPHLYTLYFEEVDDYAHWYGPDSSELAGAVKRVDEYIGRLLRGLEKLPHADRVNIILLSDHGQQAYLEDQAAFVLEDHVSLEDSAIVEGGSYLFLHFDRDDPDRARELAQTVNSQWRHGLACVPDNCPEQWRMDSNNPRFPDVALIPKPGFAVLSTVDKAAKINAGDHGWAPGAPAMHGFFIASGPAIKSGVPLGPVNNIDIYPLMVSILGLEAPQEIDGDASHLAHILRDSD